MSRIGRKPIPIPNGVKINLHEGHVEVEGPKGKLVTRLANGVHGVSKGFSKQLDIVGIGYRAQVEGKKVVFSLGYSHPIEFPIPPGIAIDVEKQTRITVSGPDKQQVGQIAASIRALRKPDPYKQKGVRYVGEQLKKKAGKTGAAT